MRYRDMRALGLPTRKTDEERAKMRHEATIRHRAIMRAYQIERSAHVKVLVPLRTPDGLCGPPCWWCGLVTDMRRGIDTPHMVTRDHLTPRKYGGYHNGFIEIVAAHKICNGMRGHEADGKWIKFPDWQESPAKMPPSQKAALRRIGAVT